MKAIFNIFFILFTTFLFFSSSLSHAASLSLDDAIKYALENNEDVRIADLSIEQMESLVREIESVIYPSLGANLSYLGTMNQNYPNQEIPFSPNPSDHTYEKGGVIASASISVQQLIFAFGAVQNAIDAAKLSKELVAKQKDKAIAALRYSVQSAYYGALFYEANYRIANESYQNVLNTQKLIEGSASVRLSQSDIIKVRADIASRKPDVDSAYLLMRQGYRLLQILCVLPEAPTELSTGYDKIPRPKITEVQLLSKLPEAYDVQLLETQVMLNMKTADAKLGQWYPTLSLVGNYQYYDQGFNAALINTNRGAEGYLGLVANFTIYDGGKALAQSKQEKISGYINMSKLSQAKRYITRGLINALENYNTYQNILVMDDAAVALAEKSYKMSLDRFLNGQTSAVELNDVERGLSMLKLKRMGTINNIYAALASIEQMVGKIK